MPNYSNTHIYKIFCKDRNIIDCYIGHTTDLKGRETTHKSRCNPNNCESNIKVYKFIRENGGWTNWEMQILDHYSTCENKKQACEKEQEWITKENPSLNDKSALITAEELREKKNEWKRNSARHNEYAKEYSANLSREKRDEKNAKQRERMAKMTVEERSAYWKQFRKPK